MGLIGLKLDDREKIYQLYYILHSTLNYLTRIYDPTSPDEPYTHSRSSSTNALAKACQSRIEKIFHLLTDPSIPAKSDKEALNARLSLCNQNMNQMYVILK